MASPANSPCNISAIPATTQVPRTAISAVIKRQTDCQLA